MKFISPFILGAIAVVAFIVAFLDFGISGASSPQEAGPITISCSVIIGACLGIWILQLIIAAITQRK